jgi:N-acyl-D-aspartate/D-glutamate deacylase
MRITRLFISIWLVALPAFAENVVLINGTIIDGTGKPRVVGNVRIRDGKVVDIGPFRPVAAETRLDVKGMIVAPGFIDLENVSATEFAKNSDARSEISRGVTTMILGSDGAGPYSIEEFMLPFDEKPPTVNIAMLAGHSTIRRQIMGAEYKRGATTAEVGLMAELLQDAMRQGAFGLASDLRTEPGSFSTADELLGLAKELSQYGGTLFVHPHDESIQGPLDVARNGKVTIQLSLNKMTPAVLTDMAKARMQGVDVGAHMYPLTEPALDLRILLQNPMVTISFAQYLQDDKAISLERAIQKLTALPASRIGLKERGVLRKGLPADIVVFNPLASSHAMNYVFVNGTMVIKDGEPTEARPGQALR